MVKRIDSDAMGVITRSLGLSGGGSQVTELLDETVDQTLDITQLVRRGRTLAASEGVFGASILNEHTGAQATIATTVDPWNLAGSEVAPFPAAISRAFDLWLLYISAFTSSGPGSFDSADITVLIPATNRAFGAAGATGMRVVAYNAEIALVGGTMLSQSSDPIGIPQRAGLRIPRNATLRWRTRNGGATSPKFQVDMFLGLYPIALGQDALV